MSLKTFKQILGSQNKVSFKFIDVIQDESQRDGSQIVRLVLAAEDAIPVVYGRTIRDNVTGETAKLEANDVVLVSIGKSALDEIDALQNKYNETEGKEGEQIITWVEEGKSGMFTSKNLKFDVAQSLEVWIVKQGESFAQFGRNRRNAAQQAQKSAVMEKINAQKTKKQHGGTDPVNEVKTEKPEVVTT